MYKGRIPGVRKKDLVCLGSVFQVDCLENKIVGFDGNTTESQ